MLHVIGGFVSVGLVVIFVINTTRQLCICLSGVRNECKQSPGYNRDLIGMAIIEKQMDQGSGSHNTWPQSPPHQERCLAGVRTALGKPHVA